MKKDTPYFIKDINRASIFFKHIFLIEEDKSIKWWFFNNGKYQLLGSRGIGVCDGTYFSLNKKDQNDAYFEFVNFVYQKIGFFSNKSVNKIFSDMRILLVSLAKIDFYYRSKEIEEYATSFVKTEIEYILIVCRSLFDLLQEFIGFSLSRIMFSFNNGKSFEKVQDLPSSFSNMLNKVDNDILMQKYKIPPYIIVFYSKYKNFFEKIKEIRDDIVHKGVDPTEYIFKLEDKGGFAFSLKNELKIIDFARHFDLLQDNGMQLMPILPILAYIIYTSINALSEFVKILENPSYIKFPDNIDIAPNYRIYYRSNYSKYYNYLEKIIEKKLYNFEK